MKRRVVIDTSSLVSAAIRPNSIPDQALTLALATSQICTCAEHLVKLEAVLRRERFDSYVSLESRLRLLRVVRENALSFTIPDLTLNQLRACCRDENDCYLLALALIAEADILISSDHDLLVLHPWRGVQIAAPSQFLALPIRLHLH